MRLRVRFFAGFRDVTGARETEIELRSPATVEQMLGSLFRRYPKLEPELLDDRGALRDFVVLLVNGRNVRDLLKGATPVRDGDEIALFPPVAGGAGDLSKHLRPNSYFCDVDSRPSAMSPRVHVKFLLHFREWAGTKETELEAATLGELIGEIEHRFHLEGKILAGTRPPPWTRILINGRDAMLAEGLETRLESGDQVAFVYPFMDGG